MNVVLINAFLLSNFFFYLSANATQESNLKFLDEVLISDVDQSLSGDLFDLNQFDQNLSQTIINFENDLTFFKLNTGPQSFSNHPIHLFLKSKPKTAHFKSKRANRKIFLTISALKIP